MDKRFEVKESKPTVKTLVIQYLGFIFGSVLYAAALNLIILPLGIYSGNITGVSQIVNDLAHMFWPIDKNLNITGIALLVINIPLIIGAYKTLSKKFFIRTAVNMVLQSILLVIIPVLETPVIEDSLTAVTIGGIIIGFGTGIVLRYGASSGGTDIIGVWFAQKYPNFSIGKVQIVISSLVFLYCAVMYDIEIVVYSVILLCISAFVLDKSHTQNVKIAVIVFTKKENASDFIMTDLVRGVTKWKGEGCYTKTPTFIFMTVISKYEASRVKQGILEVDPNAFIIFQNILEVEGNFIKRLNSVF